jgi:RimJ/RimL family protein N-acetyltransferase/uncharacterized protein YjiS (DUF1127 family)
MPGKQATTRQTNKSTNVRGKLPRVTDRWRGAITATAWLLAEWHRRTVARRRLSGIDARTLRDAGIDPALAAFEAARPPWRPLGALGRRIPATASERPRPVANEDAAPLAFFGPAAGAPASIVETLDDGVLMRLRPLSAEDRDHLVTLMRGLSERSRTHRFLAPKRDLTRRELDRLVAVDQRSHVALLATVRDAKGEVPLGVVRYVRDGASEAEFAIAVVDAHQRRGIGRLLLRRLVVVASDAGVRRLRCFMLADNLAMRRLIDGFPSRVTPDYPGTLRVELRTADMIAPTRDAG